MVRTAAPGLVMVEHCYVVAGGRTSDDQLSSASTTTRRLSRATLIDGHARL